MPINDEESVLDESADRIVVMEYLINQ